MHNTHNVPTAAILGAAGYTGQETLDRILRHPELELVALGSDSLAGRPAHELHPGLDGNVPMFSPNAEAATSGADVIFLCLGNEQAAAYVPPDGDTVVIDLGGVHRLADKALAERWYGLTPGAWSYGLPELHPAEGRLIANPGCYATASSGGEKAAASAFPRQRKITSAPLAAASWLCANIGRSPFSPGCSA